MWRLIWSAIRGRSPDDCLAIAQHTREGAVRVALDADHQAHLGLRHQSAPLAQDVGHGHDGAHIGIVRLAGEGEPKLRHDAAQCRAVVVVACVLYSACAWSHSWRRALASATVT